MNDLVINNIKLVHFVLNRMNLTGNQNYDDYFQEGVIGLINASKSYNDKLNISFSTFAYVCIKNEILKSVKKQQKYKQSIEDGFEDNETLIENIRDEKENIENVIIINETNQTLQKIIKDTLNENEIQIMKMLFGIGCREYKQREIAKLFNIPQYQVSRIKSKILKKLSKSIKIQ